MQKFSSKLVQNRLKTAAMAKFADMYEDSLKQVLDEIHKIWQDQDIEMGTLFEQLPEFKKFMFAIAKLNYQVGNGGFYQWIDNGYAADTGDYLEQTLSEICSANPKAHNLRVINGLLERVLECFGADKYGDTPGWTELSERLNASGGDPDSSSFEDWYRESDARRQVNSLMRELDASGKKAGFKVLDGVDAEVIFNVLGESDPHPEIEFLVDVNDTSVKMNFEKFLEAAQVEAGEEEDEAKALVWDQVVSQLEELQGYIQEMDGEFKESGGGDPSEDLHRLDSFYYERVKDEELWKEVAHAAEMMATEDDFEETPEVAPGAPVASEEQPKESSQDKTAGEDRKLRKPLSLDDLKKLAAPMGLEVEIDEDGKGVAVFHPEHEGYIYGTLRKGLVVAFEWPSSDDDGFAIWEALGLE